MRIDIERWKDASTLGIEIHPGVISINLPHLSIDLMTERYYRSIFNCTTEAFMKYWDDPRNWRRFWVFRIRSWSYDRSRESHP